MTKKFDTWLGLTLLGCPILTSLGEDKQMRKMTYSFWVLSSSISLYYYILSMVDLTFGVVMNIRNQEKC